MKILKTFKHSFLIAAFIMMCLTGNINLAEAKANTTTEITIVHINDAHARVAENKSSGMGYAKIYAKIKELRKNGGNVLVFDAGDAFHGQVFASLSQGESIVQIMNTIGFNTMVPGKHDFNYGSERLLQLSREANFPLLAANVFKQDGTPFLAQNTIIEAGGLKIGVFGLITPETTTKIHPKNIAGLTFQDPVEAARDQVASLKDRTDIIIALAHLGLDGEYTSAKVALEVEGIDLIVDGNSHTALPNGEKVNNTLIVQAGEHTKNLGIVKLACQNGHVVSLEASLFTSEDAQSLTPDLDLASAIKAIEDKNAVITTAVIGKTDSHLNGEREKVRTGETNLGNLIAQAMLKTAGTDAALINSGSIRTSIDKGDITKGNLINVLPFGNYLVTMKASGSVIRSALENAVSAYPGDVGAFPQIAGMSFTFDQAKKAGSRVVDVKIGGKPIEPKRIYILATNDYLAAGGDNYAMFKDCPVITEYPQLDEILAVYIEDFGTAGAILDQRIKKVEAAPVLKTKSYLVKKGDTLWKIAKDHGLNWVDVASFNKLNNPNLILPGQQILIPALNK